MESSGRVVWDPRHDRTSQRPWWAIVECDREIGRYYRWWLKRRGVSTTASAWGEHISITRGEQPRKPTQWGGSRRIHFSYSGAIETNGKRFWVPVRSADLDQLRSSLGLGGQPHYHLTIGVMLPGEPLPYWLDHLRR